MSAIVLARAIETTRTGGTGAYLLEGAAFYGARLFAAAGDGAQVIYVCEDIIAAEQTGRWELGVGAVSVGPPVSLARDLILLNSDGTTSPVSWASSGRRTIYSTYPGEWGLMLGENNLAEIRSAVAARTNLGIGSAAAKGQGAGSTLDVGFVDGFALASFVQIDQDETLTGALTLSGDLTLSGANDYEADGDFNNAGARVVLPLGSDRWAT